MEYDLETALIHIVCCPFSDDTHRGIHAGQRQSNVRSYRLQRVYADLHCDLSAHLYGILYITESCMNDSYEEQLSCSETPDPTAKWGRLGAHLFPSHPHRTL